ncbi:AraC family transcriptional regulator [Variovorax ureilyticus]|uniref:AraC family transcriptional regulator n=1 Tax=Variovorax ureilyticus TaxID=1836198 RepID=A0ABU8VLN4_9BURK
MNATAVRVQRHIRAAALAHYFEVAEAAGLNPQPLLRRAGLSRRMLVDPEQRVPLAAALQLLEVSAEASGLDDFGLQMAQARRLSDLGALSLLLTHLPSLRAVLQTLIHSRQLVGGTLALAMVESGKSTVIREELVGPAAAGSRQATELVLGILFRLCAALPGQRWNPQSVNFRHAAPADALRHRQLFNCRLKFGSDFNGFVCATADLGSPNPLADPVLAAYARRLVDVSGDAEEDTLAQTIRKVLYVQLPLGAASIEEAAKGLGMHVRTLQRQLSAEGVAFSTLVDEVRRDLALRYLAQPGYSLTRVSEELGYGQLSSFIRWFLSQFEQTPSEWRRRMRQP